MYRLYDFINIKCPAQAKLFKDRFKDRKQTNGGQRLQKTVGIDNDY